MIKVLHTRRVLERLQLWRQESAGAAAVEFVLVAPILVALYLGGFAAQELLTTYRKVCDATAQLANIASQPQCVTSAELTTLMTASTQVMAPYSTTNLQLATSEITVNAAGTGATVTWSQAYNGGTALTTGAAWTLPSQLLYPTSPNAAGTSYILVQSNYSYQANIGGVYVGGNVPMSSQLYMPPQNSGSIPLDPVCS